jgi:hypothetical protein
VFVDSDCTQFYYEDESFYFDQCSREGFAYFSAQVPQLGGVDYASVQQVVYAADSADPDDTDCDLSSAVVLTSALYSDQCTLNCYFERSWKYCTFDQCSNATATANVTYFDYHPPEPVCSAEAQLAYQAFSSSCAERISCLNPADFQPASSSSDDDDGGLSSTELVVALVVVFAVLAAVVAGVVLDRRGPGGSKESASAKEPLINENEA